MILKKTAASQVARMAQMAGYPRNEPEALNELVIAAMDAPSDDVLRQVVGDFLDRDSAQLHYDERPKCPTSGDIRRAIRDLGRPQYWQPEWGQPGAQPEYNCSTCTDSGMAGGVSVDDPWRWCSCGAAARLRADEPNAVEFQNRILRKIAERGVKVLA